MVSRLRYSIAPFSHTAVVPALCRRILRPPSEMILENRALCRLVAPVLPIKAQHPPPLPPRQ